MEPNDTACDISFSEKARIFSHDYLKCCQYISGFEHPQHFFTKKLYAKMTSTSQLLEDFLDFHGAKNSTEWFLYREYAAAIRHMTTAAYSQMHISNRMAFYILSDTEEFEKEGAKTLNFLNVSLIKLAPVVIDEARRLNIPLPEDEFSPSDFPGISTGEMLQFDIDDVNKDQQKEHIVHIASEFLNISKKFDEISFFEPYTPEELQNMVPRKVNEVEMRRFEMLVHNLQSSFDTYVIHGGYRFGNQKLKQVRGHFSVVFHLLQVIGRLLHFYERHLHDAGYKNIYKKVHDRLTSLIDPQMLLDRTVNYALYYVCHYISTGKELAREILNENIEKSSITVGIPQKLGFHSRPSLLVAKIVQYYGGQVELCIDSDRFDASSVLDIQWAGGKIQKENIQQVVFEGDIRALKDIEILAGVNYGEDTLGKGIPLPKELVYLR
jgi:phosphotransferase system HPr-like phosphotransfer protein